MTENQNPAEVDCNVITLTDYSRAALAGLMNRAEPAKLRVCEGSLETVYEVGDRIESYGDTGPWMPAEVTSVSRDYIGIAYGPASDPLNFKFSTSLPRYSGSIRTKKRRVIPARLQIMSDAGEWIDLPTEEGANQ